MMHQGVIAPSCCALIHMVSFKEVSGLGLFSRVDREIGVFRHVAPPTWLVSNFPVRPGSS